MTKVYIYTRVSTVMQTEGYSLDAQKSRMKAYCDFNDFIIAGEYEDAGISGKSIEGRKGFIQMIEDIKSEKDCISYILVYKLSRFGRNAADILSTLQIMQDYGVNLICIEDCIDTSRSSGKLMLTVLAAVAEIERENIRAQTLEGRKQKAREGLWNGGFAPYGYKLVNGKLVISKTEASTVRLIFDKFTSTDLGVNGVAKYLEDIGIEKNPRENGTLRVFNAHLIRIILSNPVYCGKIAFGRRKTERIPGSNEYHMVKQDKYILSDGEHKAIISEEQWNKAQEKLIKCKDKHEIVKSAVNGKYHLLSGVMLCPVCGAGMYGNKVSKYNKDGSKYRDFYYYGCKHRKLLNDRKCNFKNQIPEEQPDRIVMNIISEALGNTAFAGFMKRKIYQKADVKSAVQEASGIKKKLGLLKNKRKNIQKSISVLDHSNEYYSQMKQDYTDKLDKLDDTIEAAENQLALAENKKKAAESGMLTEDTIFQLLINFESVFNVMDDIEKRNLVNSLISEVRIHDECPADGNWFKSMKFRLPFDADNTADVYDEETWNGFTVMLADLFMKYVLVVEIDGI